MVKQDNSSSSELSRRQFLNLLSVGGGAITLSALGVSVPARTTAEGYSIFDETMVVMSWPEIQEAAENGAIILLPVAVIEEHGPHMGLAPDIYLTYLWCKLTRRALEAKGIQALIAPPFYWGINESTRAFPGSFTVREETFKAVLYDIHSSLKQWGFSTILSFNEHGDPTHNRVLHEAVREAHDGLALDAYCVCREGTPVIDEGYVIFHQSSPLPASFIGHLDIHAGALETGQMAVWFPHHVKTEIARTLEPSTGFEPLGYYGDPASFDALKADDVKKFNDDFAARTADAIETFLKAKDAK